MEKITVASGLYSPFNPHKLAFIYSKQLTIYKADIPAAPLLQARIQQSKSFCIHPCGMVLLNLTENLLVKYLFSCNKINRVFQKTITGNIVRYNVQGTLVLLLNQHQVVVLNHTGLEELYRITLQKSATPPTGFRVCWGSIVQIEYSYFNSVFLDYRQRRKPRERLIAGEMVRLIREKFMVVKVAVNCKWRIEVEDGDGSRIQHQFEKDVVAIEILDSSLFFVLTKNELLLLEVRSGSFSLSLACIGNKVLKTDCKDIMLFEDKQTMVLRTCDNEFYSLKVSSLGKESSWLEKYYSHFFSCYQIHQKEDLIPIEAQIPLPPQTVQITDKALTDKISASKARLESRQRQRLENIKKIYVQADKLKHKSRQDRYSIEQQYENDLKDCKKKVEDVMARQIALEASLSALKQQNKTHIKQIQQQFYCCIGHAQQIFDDSIKHNMKALQQVTRMVKNYKSQLVWCKQEQQEFKQDFHQQARKRLVLQQLVEKNRAQSIQKQSAEIKTLLQIKNSNQYLLSMTMIDLERQLFMQEKLQGMDCGEEFAHSSQGLEDKILSLIRTEREIQIKIQQLNKTGTLNQDIGHLLRKQIFKLQNRFQMYSQKEKQMFDDLQQIITHSSQLHLSIKDLQYQIRKAQSVLKDKQFSKAKSTRLFSTFIYQLNQAVKSSNLRSALHEIVLKLSKLQGSVEESKAEDQNLMDSISMQKTVIEKYMSALNTTWQTLSTKRAAWCKIERQLTAELVQSAKSEQRKSKSLKKHMHILQKMQSGSEFLRRRQRAKTLRAA